MHRQAGNAVHQHIQPISEERAWLEFGEVLARTASAQIMIARTQLSSSVHIQVDIDSSPKQVLDDYVKELHIRGHDIIVLVVSPKDGNFFCRCKSCGKTVRVYMGPYGDTTDIYSDFKEGDQCTLKQLNLHEPEVDS